MDLKIDREKVKLYLQLALAYFVLMLFKELVQNPESFFTRAVNTLWRMPYILFINYLFYEFTAKYFKLNIRKLLIFIVLLFFQFMLFSYGLYAWRKLGIFLNIHTDLTEPGQKLSKLLEDQTAVSVGSVFFFGIVKHIYDYRRLMISAQQLQMQKQEAELNYLKSQTNPHFLFNTLNNIYSLSRDKSDLAPESILRLSKILRYMLYETSGEFIAIEQELKIIADYIDLEKLRYDESLRVNYNYDIEDMKQALPPLLLIPLVENAFKHGVSETRNQPYVDIHLSVKQRQLLLTVKNSTEEFAAESGIKENIGLSNLRRQLQLLYKEYDLSVVKGDSVFTATLKINLASHV
jgi:two-component system, LytTR family, sensor kinase